jgi:hypothetical protein
VKIYTNNKKYNRIDNSFDFKLTVFCDICNRLCLLAKGYITAFLVMLKGLTQQHYYNCALLTKTFDNVYTHMRNFFKGQEYYQKNLIKWNAIILQDFISDNLKKSVL